MSFVTDDPIRDFLQHDVEHSELLESLPRCSECDEPIQDEYAFYINDEWICDRCMRVCYRREVVIDG